MNRLFCVLLTILLLSSTAVFAEESIQVGNVKSVAIGDNANEELTSEGEDVSSLPSSDADSASPQATPEADNAANLKTRINFERGYSLSLPDGWKYYEVTSEMAATGVIYALSSSDGKQQLYIQEWETDCTDMETLETIIRNTTTPQSSGIHEFNGIPFIVYDLPSEDLSCAATLGKGKVLNIIFAPQSDSSFMVTAARIMQSFSFSKQ